MEDKKQEPQYEKPTSTLDLERRQAEDYVPPSQLVQAGEPGDTPFDRGGFIGVDPAYQNAANETEQPMRQTEGAEAELISAAGQDENLPDFDGESPLPQVDPEKDPLVSTPTENSGETAATSTGKADAEKSAPAKKTASAPSKPNQ